MTSANQTTCADCKNEKESSETIDLACKNHSICSKCYFTRGKAYKDLACSECSGEKKGIWIFADDSNIWIEAMKLKGKQKGFKAPNLDTGEEEYQSIVLRDTSC